MANEVSDSDDLTGMSLEGAAPAIDAARQAALVNTLEGEIVPRLLLLCRSEGGLKVAEGAPGNSTESGDAEELVRLLLAHGPDMAGEYVQAIRQQSDSQDRINVDVLVRAAYQLAGRWNNRGLSDPELMQGLAALQDIAQRYK